MEGLIAEEQDGMVKEDLGFGDERGEGKCTSEVEEKLPSISTAARYCRWLDRGTCR